MGAYRALGYRERISGIINYSYTGQLDWAGLLTVELLLLETGSSKG